MAGARRQGGWVRRAAWFALAPVLLFLAASFYVELRYAQRIHARSDAPEAPVAVVFGAGLAPGGVPSGVLKQRMDAAIALYRSGKVKKLLVSGDNTDPYHDETKAMRRYAIDRGLPSRDVVGDYAGTSTYDTCYRALEIFGVREALLVTQDFHLPRALYIANSLGIDAHGVHADAQPRRLRRYQPRELVARAVTVGAVLLRPEPRIMGKKESLEPAEQEPAPAQSKQEKP